MFAGYVPPSDTAFDVIGLLVVVSIVVDPFDIDCSRVIKAWALEGHITPGYCSVEYAEEEEENRNHEMNSFLHCITPFVFFYCLHFPSSMVPGRRVASRRPVDFTFLLCR